MKLNCLGCGNAINLGEEYESFTGCIRCNACSAILKVHLDDSKLKEIEFVRFARQLVNADDARGRSY